MKRHIIILFLFSIIFLSFSARVYSMERVSAINNNNRNKYFNSLLILDKERSWEDDLDKGMVQIIKIIKTFYDYLIVLVPIVLLLFGTLDFFKAVAAGDEKSLKAAQSAVGRRLMWAFIALSGMLIFKLIMSLVVGGNAWRSYW